MQHMSDSSHRDRSGAGSLRDGDADLASAATLHRSCYGVQVLIAGRSKQWRDAMNAQVRQAGYNATIVDSAVDALTVLALGLPVDVLLTDVDLRGKLDCSRLAREARAMRPNLRVIFARDLRDNDDEVLQDAYVLPPGRRFGGVAKTMRTALSDA